MERFGAGPADRIAEQVERPDVVRRRGEGERAGIADLVAREIERDARDQLGLRERVRAAIAERVVAQLHAAQRRERGARRTCEDLRTRDAEPALVEHELL